MIFLFGTRQGKCYTKGCRLAVIEILHFNNKMELIKQNGHTIKLTYSQCLEYMWSLVAGGTGMVASSSIFVIRDLFCLLHVVRHGTEALLYINYPREAAASTCLATISG